MKKETIILQQERDFGDKINATFSFVSQNFKTLFLSLLYFAGPLGLIGGIANGIVQSSMLGQIGDSFKMNVLCVMLNYVCINLINSIQINS